MSLFVNADNGSGFSYNEMLMEIERLEKMDETELNKLFMKRLEEESTMEKDRNDRKYLKALNLLELTRAEKSQRAKGLTRMQEHKLKMAIKNVTDDKILDRIEFYEYRRSHKNGISEMETKKHKREKTVYNLLVDEYRLRKDKKKESLGV